MTLTLGQRLDDIDAKIDKAENAQRSQLGDKQIDRGSLAAMYKQREKIVLKIEAYGANYIEGQNTKPKKAFVGVSFG